MARDPRELILRRRKRFVAAALSGAAVLSSCETQPQPCLEPGPVTSSTASQGGAAGMGGMGAGGDTGAGGSSSE